MTLIEVFEKFPTEQSCIEHLEMLRWGGVVVSPFCAISRVYKCKDNKYKCRITNKYFNVRTKTIFDNTKVSLMHWFYALACYSLDEHISSHELARQIGVTQKTAWFIIRRFEWAFVQAEFWEASRSAELDTMLGSLNIEVAKHTLKDLRLN